MFEWLKNSFNIITELYTLYKINSILTQLQSSSTLSPNQPILLASLKSYILNGGSLYIKFAQWYISRLRYNTNPNTIALVEYMTDLFENCPSHSLEYTCDIYAKTRNHPLSDYIDMSSLTEIASGSIGTVYKARELNTGNMIAIKIRHPNIEHEIAKKYSIINMLKRIQSIHYFRHKYNLCFDLNDFLNGIYKQIDLTNEAANNRQMAQLHKNNPVICIPNVLFANENILISEYIETIEVDSLSEYNRNIIAVNLVCLLYQMLLIDNFIHGDLHYKNWKIKQIFINDRMLYQIVLFDMGICFNIDDINMSRDFWDALENNDIDSIINIIQKLCFNTNYNEYNTKNILNDDLIIKLKELINDVNANNINSVNVLRCVVDFFNTHELNIHPFIINLLILICLVEQFLKQNNYMKSDTSFQNMFDIIKSNRLDIITYCKCNNTYLEVAKLIKNKIKFMAKNNISTSKISLNLSNPE